MVLHPLLPIRRGDSMAVKPTEVVAVKVRMKEKLRRELQVEAKRDGISVNAVIERRLNRSLIDDKVMDIIAVAAKAASAAVAEQVNERITNLIRAYDAEITRANQRILGIEHVQSLHELILKKGDSNG
jgi:hypothetical protein